MKNEKVCRKLKFKFFVIFKNSSKRENNEISNIFRSFWFLVLLGIFKLPTEIKGKVIDCERTGDLHWNYTGTLTTCYMEVSTSTSEYGPTIATRDGSVTGLTFNTNLKIVYLPVRVAENFPYLRAYSAYGCAVKEITKWNFKGLTRMNAVWLSQNQIEFIPSDAFEDLRELEHIGLSE